MIKILFWQIMFKEIRGKNFNSWLANKEILAEKYSVESRRDSYTKRESCGACDADITEYHFADVYGRSLAQCSECGLVQSLYTPSEALLSLFYNDAIYVDFYEKHGFQNHERRKEQFGRERVKDWMTFSTKDEGDQAPLKVFDAGCGTGFTLEVGQELGLEVAGCDLNQACVEFCHSNGLEDVHHLSLERYTHMYPNKKFDIVSLYDVLEHTPDIRNTLTCARQILKTGGTLVLYVPNIDSYIVNTITLSQVQWAWTPFHLYYFGKPSLTRLLENSGFNVMATATGGMDIYDIHDYINKNLEMQSVLYKQEMWEMKTKLQLIIDSSGMGSILRVFAQML